MFNPPDILYNPLENIQHSKLVLVLVNNGVFSWEKSFIKKKIVFLELFYLSLNIGKTISKQQNGTTQRYLNSSSYNVCSKSWKQETEMVYIQLHSVNIRINNSITYQN